MTDDKLTKGNDLRQRIAVLDKELVLMGQVTDAELLNSFVVRWRGDPAFHALVSSTTAQQIHRAMVEDFEAQRRRLAAEFNDL